MNPIACNLLGFVRGIARDCKPLSRQTQPPMWGFIDHSGGNGFGLRGISTSFVDVNGNLCN